MRIVTDKVTRSVPTGALTYAERDKERWGIFSAEREGDDAALMRYLKHYCPNDPHVQSYPGRDNNTTGAPSSFAQQ